MLKLTLNSCNAILLLLVATMLMGLPQASAKGIEHQGFLIGPTGQPLDGNYDITFTLYEGRDSTVVWAETHTGVEVKHGKFRVELGSNTPFESAPIRSNRMHQLGTRVGNEDEQKPRQPFQITTTASSIPASHSGGIKASIPVAAAPTIVAPAISVNANMAGAGASNQDLNRHIGNKNNPHKVTAAQIGAATQADIYSHAQNPSAHHRKTSSFSELQDKIGSTQVAANTITGTHILNASIKAEDIADRAITAKKIKGGTGSGVDADLVDGMQANEIIAAARDEVRTPISALPFTISKSGSYFLTADLNVSQQPGITVKADNVTIDLMGFSIIGDASKFNGISLEGTHNVTVQNGSIRGFGAAGIFTSSGDGHRIIQVRAIANGSGGIFAFSSGTLISECMAWGNSSVGIAAGTNSIVRNSISRANQGNGISAESGSSLIGNTIFGNKGEYGISATGSTIRDNSVHSNADTGIFAVTSTLIGNTVSNNSGWGIQASDGSTVLSNTVNMNNKADMPEKGGLSVGDDCQIKGNTVSSNKRNNIHVSGSDNIIEENLVTDSLGGNGINFAHPANGPQNFYANNRASGNGKDYAGKLPTGRADGGGNASF